MKMNRIIEATAVLAFALASAKGAPKEDWREAIVQLVHLHGRPEMADYTVTDETAEYVLRPHSTKSALQFLAAVGGQRDGEIYYAIAVAAGDHVQIARSGRGMKLKDQRGKQYDGLIVSSRLLHPQD